MVFCATMLEWKKSLTELTKEELIEVVSELESLANHPKTDLWSEEIREIIYKKRPGWKIHNRE